MKKFHKEIITGSAILLVFVLVLACYFQNTEEQKKTEQIDLYTLIPPESEMLVTVNRPHTFSSLILSQPHFYHQFNKYIPDIYLTIISNIPTNQPVILSFHPEGILLYTKPDALTLKKMEKEIFPSRFNAYPPFRQKENNINYTFYPDSASRFFCSVLNQGVWIGGYNSKLLKEATGKTGILTYSFPAEMQSAIQSLDTNAPLNICFCSELPDLTVQINDSLVWKPRQSWLTTDIFTSEGNICCHGSLPIAGMDSLSIHLTDSLTQRLEKFFNPSDLTVQTYTEDAKLFYTVCASLKEAQNKTKPGYVIE